MPDEIRMIHGQLRNLERRNDHIYSVELWLMNGKVNKNGWQFVPDAKGNFIELARQNDNSIGIFETGNFYDAFNPALG